MNRFKKFFTGLTSSTTKRKSPQENHLKEEDDDVTQWLATDKRTIRVAVFGQERSGKTTLCRQLQILQVPAPFSAKECASAVAVVREIIRESIQEVAKSMVADEVQFTDEKKQSALQFCSNDITDCDCWKDKSFCENTKLLCGETITMEYISKLSHINISDNITYFLKRLEAVMLEDYSASAEDIVRCGQKASDIKHLHLPVTLSRNDFFFSILLERDALRLPSVLPHTQAVIFTLDLQSYTLQPPHDLLTSLDLFRQILSSKYLPDVHVILLLNKMDKLEEATDAGKQFDSFVESVHASHPCSAFLQTWHTWEGASLEEQRTFIESYPNKDGDAPAVLDSHQRRASFRKKSSLIQTLMKKKGIQSQTVQTAVFIRRLCLDVFSSIRQVSHSGNTSEKKPLTVHYTCLTDHYTTRKVCESWKNMLLVDHV